jgi:vancomycin permeability regulator SanA
MADAAASGVRSMLVVSQAYHLPRALYLAAHAGIEAVGVPAHEGRRRLLNLVHVTVREMVARAETMVEVLIRGVRGAGPVPDVIKTGP